MDNPLAIAARESRSPDELYGLAFRHFQALFRSLPNCNASKVQLISHLPGQVYSERTALGAVLTAAVIAMFDHEETNRGDWSKVSLAEIPVYMKTMPKELRNRLDETIIAQGATVGIGLMAADIVLMTVLEWERHDHSKIKQWLRALDKAMRIHQRRTSPPLDDPFLRDAKRLAVEQLRPLVARIQDRFTKKRRNPTAKQIVEAFAEEAKEVDAPFVRDNFEMLLAFYGRDPLAFLHLSAEKLFDEFAAFTGTHQADYVRKKISALK